MCTRAPEHPLSTHSARRTRISPSIRTISSSGYTRTAAISAREFFLTSGSVLAFRVPDRLIELGQHEHLSRKGEGERERGGENLESGETREADDVDKNYHTLWPFSFHRVIFIAGFSSLVFPREPNRHRFSSSSSFARYRFVPFFAKENFIFTELLLYLTIVFYFRLTGERLTLRFVINKQADE